MSATNSLLRHVPVLSTSRILQYIGSLVLLRIVVKLAGFGEKVALAHYFELNTALDAFTAASSVPMMFLFTIRAVAGPTILPMFVRRVRAQDATGAWSQWNAWLLMATMLLIAIAAICFVFVDRLAWLLAPGFDVGRHALCVQMLKVMMPVSVVMGLQPLFTIVLNAQRSFILPTWSEFVAKFVMIVALVLFGSRLGISTAVWGTAAGAVLSLIVCVIGSYPAWQGRGASPGYKDPDFRVVSLLMLAPALGAISSRIGDIAQTAACSMLAPGSVAALSFAWKIVNMPLLIIPLASGTVLFTLFAEMNQSGQHESAGQMLAVGVRVMLFIFLPLVVWTCVLSEPITAFVYQRGAFDSDSTFLVSMTLLWLAPIMCALSVEALVVQHFYSRLDVWPPVLVGVAGVALRVLLIIVFMHRWGLAGVAIAIVIGRFAKVLVLVALVCSRGKVSMRHFDFGGIFLMGLASIASGGVAFAVVSVFGPHIDSSTLGQATMLAAAGTMGAAAYLYVAYWLGNKECHYIVNRITQRLRGLRRFA